MAVPRVSDAEFEVMKVLWGRSPQTSQEVIDALKGGRDWTPQTVKTMLNRLVKKGALAFDKDGKNYLYRPAVGRDACVAAESASFLDRVFDGAVGPLLLHFAKGGKLDGKELEELKRALRGDN